MATSKTPTEDDLTTCPICYEVYNEPKCLTVCLHTFCKSCISSYVISTQEKCGEKYTSGFHCPVCREFYDTGNDIHVWLKNLPKNYFIVNLMDRNKMQSMTKENDCNICQRSNQTNVSATSWCIDCCDKLCETCVKFHKGNKSSMDHEIVDLEKCTGSRSREMIFCKKHTNRKLEVYCFDHDIPCCLMCATVQHRKCEKVESLEECSVSIKTKQEVSDLSKLSEKLHEQCKAELDRLASDKENYLKQTADIRSHIKTAVENAVTHLRRKEKEVEENVTSIEKKISIQISDKISVLKDTETRIKRCIEQLEGRNSLSNVELFLMFKRTKKDCNSVRLLLVQASEKYEKYKVSLKLNDMIMNLSKSLSSVGEVCFQAHAQCENDFLSDSLTLEKTIEGPNGDRISDIEIIDHTHIIAVGEYESSIYLFNTNGTLLVTHKLSSFASPRGVTRTQQYKVAVAGYGSQALEIVNIEIKRTPSMTTERTINLPFHPCGIAFRDDKFVVTSQNIIYNVDKNGKILTQSQNIGSFLWGLHLQSNGNIICTNHVSDGVKVFCIEQMNDLSNVFEFHDNSLIFPIGVTTDTDGNIYVVGYTSNNVFQLKSDGKLVRQIICNDKTLCNPFAIRVCSTNESTKLILAERNKIRIYTFDKKKR